MCFRKKLVLRFVFILFFLIPNICIASLLADNVFGMTHYDMHNSSYSVNTNLSKDVHNNSEAIDDENYLLYSLFITGTFNTSETFQINQFINLCNRQSRVFKYSLFIVSFFLLAGYCFFETECLSVITGHLNELITIYIHKSDGKKRCA